MVLLLVNAVARLRLFLSAIVFGRIGFGGRAARDGDRVERLDFVLRAVVDDHPLGLQDAAMARDLVRQKLQRAGRLGVDALEILAAGLHLQVEHVGLEDFGVRRVAFGVRNGLRFEIAVAGGGSASRVRCRRRNRDRRDCRSSWCSKWRHGATSLRITRAVHLLDGVGIVVFHVDGVGGILDLLARLLVGAMRFERRRSNRYPGPSTLRCFGPRR